MQTERIKANSFSNYIISFMVYGILLWGYNIIASWATMLSGSWSVFGFLYGPYDLFSAFCVLLVMLVFYLLGKISKDINPTPILLIVLSFIMFGVLEFLGSMVFEMIFKTLPWDYSGRLLNINGRVCIEHLVAMTIIEVICVYGAQPLLNKGLNKVNIVVKYILAMVVLAVVITDIACTVIK